MFPTQSLFRFIEIEIQFESKNLLGLPMKTIQRMENLILIRSSKPVLHHALGNKENFIETYTLLARILVL